MGAAASFTYGIALGASVMFLMDPRQGGARRARIRDKSLRAVHEVEDAAAIGARDLSHRGEGLIARLLGSGRPTISDDVIVERVRSTLGRHCSHPHAIEVKAKGDGVVELKGPVLGVEVNDVLSAIARVRGVEEIDNDLEVHAEPGDVPGLQGEPTRRSRVVRITPAAKLVAGVALAGTAAASLVAGHPIGLLVGGSGVLGIARSMNQRSGLVRSRSRQRPRRPAHTASEPAPEPMPQRGSAF